jgi:hypothetical protein
MTQFLYTLLYSRFLFTLRTRTKRSIPKIVYKCNAISALKKYLRFFCFNIGLLCLCTGRTPIVLCSMTDHALSFGKKKHGYEFLNTRNDFHSGQKFILNFQLLRKGVRHTIVWSTIFFASRKLVCFFTNFKTLLLKLK